jgi:hypothetical protein
LIDFFLADSLFFSIFSARAIIICSCSSS